MADVTSSEGSLAALEPFVGEWRMVVSFMPPVDAGARVSFEWLPGRRFLIQRWEVPVPEAPDGIAVIGADPESEGNYLQHYFDARGIARVYKMGFGDGVWTLRREAADFSPLDFAQRFVGRIDGDVIDGRWETGRDGGWELDFGLRYTRRS